MNSTEITHPIWEWRSEYLNKMNNAIKELYKQFGGFLVGKDIKDQDKYFLVCYDGRVPFSFKRDGYFQINLDPLELDCYGDLRSVHYKEFKDAFDECNNIITNRFMDGEKFREHLLRDLNVAGHLITDEMFAQLKKENE